MESKNQKNTCVFVGLCTVLTHQNHKMHSAFWFLGSIGSKNQKNSRKTKENQKNLEKTKKPKQSSKTSKVFGSLVFWFSRFFWFSLVFLEFFWFFELTSASELVKSANTNLSLFIGGLCLHPPSAKDNTKCIWMRKC